jgi:tellurite resistance protein
LDHFLFLYLVKIVAAAHETLAELADPVQCCFIGLIGVATMIVAMGLLPRPRTVAEVLPRCPTLGIQLAAAPVCALAYLNVTAGPPDLFSHALIGYGLLQALVLLRLLPWIRKQSFSMAYWSFTFGATALAWAPLRLIQSDDKGAIADLAPLLFVASNIVVGLVATASVWLIVRGRLGLKYHVIYAGASARKVRAG